jgi:hypothetical protein
MQRDIQLRNGEHRLFPHFWITQITHVALAKAMTATAGDFKPFPPGAYSASMCSRIPAEIRLEIMFGRFSIIELLMRQCELLTLNVQIAPINVMDKDFIEVDAPSVLLRTITPTFVEFFEEHVDWLLRNVNADRSKWSPLWNFARVVRNAITHRGLSWENANAPPVSWRGLTYSRADKGIDVVGRDFLYGDFLLLMLDLSDELDQLGCP